MTIDCAGDDKMAKELEAFLKNYNFDVKVEESLVMIEEMNVEKILKSFLEETEHSEYTLRKLDSENFLLSKEVAIEDFGFVRCEMCGYVVSTEEEMLVHRRAHGIQLL